MGILFISRCFKAAHLTQFFDVFSTFPDKFARFAVKSESVDGFAPFLDQKNPCEKVELHSDVFGTLKHNKNNENSKN